METIVLLHGIWMKPVVMQGLAVRLRKAGYITRCFSYPSLIKTPKQNAQLLHQYIQSVPGDTVHFVAHSLGGIVLMHYFHLYKDQRPGRVLLLGSPIGGSERARQFGQLPFLQAALGKSTEQGLLGDVPTWAGDRDLGMIAGSRSMGVGNLLGRSADVNDGAVFLSETQIPELSDHVTLPVSHAGMLVSAKVALQVIHFIKNGYFALSL